MQASKRYLWLIRHAKSSWADSTQTDFERGLNARGNRDGPHMEQWLAQQPHGATWIWTSDAVRALATTAFVQRAFGTPDPAVIHEHGLYHADPNTLLDVIRTTPPEIASVAVVAHNPGLTYLANQLANLPGGQLATDNLPTFGVALFAVNNDWINCSPTTTSLVEMMVPKKL